MQSFLPVPFSFQSSFSSKTHIDGLQMMINKMWTHCTFKVVFSDLRVSLPSLFVIVLLEYASAQKRELREIIIHSQVNPAVLFKHLN